MQGNETAELDSTQDSTLALFYAENILRDSPILGQIRKLRDTMSRDSEGNLISYDDMYLRIQSEADKLPTLELQMSIAPGHEGVYQRQLLHALELIIEEYERVLRKVINLKSKLLNALNLMKNSKAQFAAFYSIGLPVACHYAAIPKLKITAAHAKDMAGSEFSRLVDSMDILAVSMVSELEILESEIKNKKKTQLEKYQLGKDQVNAMWDSIPMPKGVGLDDNPNSLIGEDIEEEEEGMPSFVSKYSKEVRVSSSPSYVKPLDLLCSVCGEPQFNTTSGDVCPNGHGGAPGVPAASKVGFTKFGDAVPINPIILEDGQKETILSEEDMLEFFGGALTGRPPIRTDSTQVQSTPYILDEGDF